MQPSNINDTRLAHTNLYFSASIRSQKKGKRNVYALDRDACMSYRFYYYYHLERARFDDAIMLMEREFFISGRKIADRLTENNELLKDIALNAPSHKQLKQRYPHFNWN